VVSAQTTPSPLAAFKFTKTGPPSEAVFAFGEDSSTQGKKNRVD
jgi:hypothetical protein